MKALIEKFKPIVLDQTKSFLFGVGSLLLILLVIVIIGTLFKIQHGTLYTVVEILRMVIMALAVATLGKIVRVKLGK